MAVWTILALALIGGGAPAARSGGESAISTGFFCGPPVEQSTPDRFLQALDAGFTFSMPPCANETGYTVAQNLQILDAAQAAGTTAIVFDDRMQAALDDPSARGQLLDAIVLAYGSHPALGGYYVYDEVPPERIGDAAAVVSGLRARDPRHPAFVTLFPDYAGIPDYDQYLRDYLQRVRPETIVYDYYPFLADGTDRAGYFANLGSVRRVALDSSTPFWLFAQLTKHLGYRRAGESEKRWQALQALAYGARGVMFFTYWSDVNAAFPEPGVIDPRTGLPTAHYSEVQQVNGEVRALGQALAATSSQDVFHNGPLAPGATMRPPRSPVYFPSSAPITTGLFDSADYGYALLANRNYRASVSTSAVLSFGASRPEQLDLADGRWIPVHPIRGQRHSVTIRLTLAPAAGALFRTLKPVPSGPPGAEAVFGRVRANAGHWHLLDSRGRTYELRRAKWRACPSGFALVGARVQPNGFWLCARSDLARRVFFVGNVAKGSTRVYRVRAGRVRRLPSARRFSCPRRSSLIGRLRGREGFWLCLAPAR